MHPKIAARRCRIESGVLLRSRDELIAALGELGNTLQFAGRTLGDAALEATALSLRAAQDNLRRCTEADPELPQRLLDIAHVTQGLMLPTATVARAMAAARGGDEGN